MERHQALKANLTNESMICQEKFLLHQYTAIHNTGRKDNGLD